MTKKNIKILEEILANSYILLIKTQNYHWNIKGNNFVSIHELLGNQYQDKCEDNNCMALLSTQVFVSLIIIPFPKYFKTVILP
jgi:hypothetical protein